MEESLIGFSYQVAMTVIVVPDTELGNGTSPIAQLMKNPGGDHIV
jgi:hypothetical protein